MSTNSTRVIAEILEEKSHLTIKGSAEDELASAAACYAAATVGVNRLSQMISFTNWPWGLDGWEKLVVPKTRRQRLVAAAALLVAEIERMEDE